MSFWKNVAAWATKMEQQTAERKARKSGLNNQLTYAGFHNTITALSGEIAKHFETAGGLLVQHISTCTNDLAIATKSLFTKEMDEFRNWMDHGFKSLDNTIYESVRCVVQTANDASEERHKEADERSLRHHNIVINNILGLFQHQKTADDNNSQRYVALVERLNDMEIRNFERHDITFKTVIALFENLTEQVQSKKRPIIVTNAGPTLAWMMDNAEELIRFGTAMNNLRENNAPPNITVLEAVKSIRAMADFGMLDIKNAIDEKARQWGIN